MAEQRRRRWMVEVRQVTRHMMMVEAETQSEARCLAREDAYRDDALTEAKYTSVAVGTPRLVIVEDDVLASGEDLIVFG